MANVSVEELLSTLQKSNLPMDSGLNMQNALPGAEQAIGGTIRGSDTIRKDMLGKHMAQLEQVAQMDAKLAGVYGDPSSNLYIENPLAREKVKMGASTTGYNAATAIKSRIKQHDTEIESEISDALQLYKQLTTVQLREEKSDDAEGKKNAKEIEKERKKLGITIGEQAGIVVNGEYDPDALELYLTSPVDFQNYLIRDLESMPEEQRPDKGFTYNEIKVWLKGWQDKFKPKAKTTEEKKALELAKMMEQLNPEGLTDEQKRLLEENTE